MIEQSATKISYTGDGSTKVFPFSFPFDKSSDIHGAIYDSTTKETTELTSDYYVDVSGKKFCYPGYPSGQEPAASQQPAVLKSTQTITIYRETEISQLTDLGDKYPLPNIEAMGDKAIMILQEHNEQLARCVKTAISDTETPEERYLEMQTYVSATQEAANSASISASSAQSSATKASASETAAATSAQNAANSAAAAANSQRVAANNAGIATTKASQANTSASNAAASAARAESSANTATSAMNNAVNSAASAAKSAQSAAQSAGDAQDAANRAKASELNATSTLVQTATYANQADQKLAAINAMSVPAWDAFKSYSFPDVVAYTDGNTYRCIGTNVAAGTVPYNSSQWVRLTVLGGDDYFDIDEFGGIMPRTYPTYSVYWSLDDEGNIMPKGTDVEIVDATTTAAETAAAAAAASATAASTSAATAKTAATSASADAAAAKTAAQQAIASQYLETDDNNDVTLKVSSSTSGTDTTGSTSDSTSTSGTSDTGSSDTSSGS